MSRWFPIAAALFLIIAAGVANGLWVDRWTVSPELALMTERIHDVPLTIGDWVGKENEDGKDLTQRLIREGTLHALVSRTYRNSKTGEEVSLLMATGRPGPISTHNPLTCYNASGFTQVGRVRSSAITPPESTTTAEFSRCAFRRSRASGTDALTVYWAWNSPQGWIPASDPRLAFASYRALTKIYVVENSSPSALADGQADSATRFLQHALPQIDAVLFGKSASADTPKTAAAPASTSASPAIGG